VILNPELSRAENQGFAKHLDDIVVELQHEVVNTIKVALSEFCFPCRILNLSDPLELHSVILIFIVKPVGAHFFGNNLNHLLALEDDPRELGAFEPIILNSCNLSGRLPAIRKGPSGDTVSVVNESPNLWPSAIETKAICLEGYETHRTVSTERKRYATAAGSKGRAWTEHRSSGATASGIGQRRFVIIELL
jgi:hypothetical protein